MKISVIFCHPNEKSFNHAIAARAVETLQGNGHDVVFHDLYAEEFDPILPAEEIQRDVALPPMIERHCTEIAAAEGIVIVHPNWWGQPPAVLKGWIDRVMRPGIAYRFNEGDRGDGIPQGLLSAKAVLVFTTSNTPAEREQTIFGDPLETLWKNCVFGLCGACNFHRKNFEVIVTSTEEQRQAWLKEVREVTARYFPPVKS
jgi:NAD(P)H dehydrogenase (quinone)